MKILLINPLVREWAKPNVLPLGLGYIASVLRNNGHDVEVLDINGWRFSKEEVIEKIKSSEFDLAGIGAIVTVYKYVKWLIGLIKEHHPKKKLVIGGSVGTSIPHIIFEKTKADIVCIGEGEITVLETINALLDNKELSGVNGIWYRDNDGKVCKNEIRLPIKDMDSIPFPAWDLFPMEIYLKNPVGAPNRNKWTDGSFQNSNEVLSMNLSGTRGCPYKCIYCYHDFMGQGWRHRSPLNIIKEMGFLYEKYGVEYFHFVDDEFCLRKRFVYEFCKELKNELKNAFTWGCTGRVNIMTEDLIATMVDAGCVLIGYGLESGSQTILNTLKKGVTIEQAKYAVQLTRKHVGWVDASFMVGSPGENRETIQETIDFCKDLDLNPEVIFFTTPYPGTDLYKIAMEQGKINDEEDYILNLGEQGEKIRVNFSQLSDQELWEAQEYMIDKLDAWNKIKHPESR